MKLSLLSLVIIIAFILSWCTQPFSSLPDTTTTGDEHIDVPTNDIQEALEDQLREENGEYTLFFDDTHTSKTFTLHHKADQRTTIAFINDGFKKVTIDIVLPTTDTWANLRLSQIIMPDGTMDGPFGLQTEYDLNQNGWYELIISESLMAWDPWTGDVQVTVSLSK